MKSQELKEGFKEAKMWQDQADKLRAELQALTRRGLFTLKSQKAFDEKSKQLKTVDKMFSLQCKLSGLEVSKFGRLK
jgi:hypothetical protein